MDRPSIPKQRRGTQLPSRSEHKEQMPHDPHSRFQTELVHQMALQSPDNNFVISPLGIKYNLFLSVICSSGQINNEVLKFLDMQSTEKVVIEFKNQLQALSSQSDFEFPFANAVFLDSDIRLVQSFRKLCSDKMGAQCEEVSFIVRPTVAQKVNAWLRRQMGNAFPAEFTAETLSPKLALLYLSAVSWKAQWRNSFPRHFVKQELFWMNAQQSAEVEMMHAEFMSYQGEVASLAATAVCIPYSGKELCMLVLLPLANDGLRELETRLHDVDLTHIVDNLPTKNVHLALPKFTINYNAMLNPALQALGVTNLFAPMTDYPLMCSRRVASTQMRQMTSIRVDEAGTDAARHKVNFTVLRASLGPTQEVIVNRPFLFAVLDPERVYFAGHVVKF